MQIDTKLPSYIEKLIFNELNAKYEPDYSKFNKNLDLDNEKVKIYLGTYFPRSYAESYLIYTELLKNKAIKEKYKCKNEINILDIGSGSGGNLVGLLFALKENLPQNLNINIFTIDGNEESLKVLSKIIYKIQIKYNLNIALRSQFISFDSINGLYKDTKGYLEESYDFIMSSKMINEIIKEDVKAYYDFCNCFSKHLSKDGFLSLIDVTIKTNFKYLPIILNDQVNKFVKYNNNFKTIVPTSCNFYEEKCNKECFTNNIFYISHKEKQNDISKITYRILTNSNFANDILSGIAVGGLVGKTKYENKYCHLVKENKNINAFKVSNEME